MARARAERAVRARRRAKEVPSRSAAPQTRRSGSAAYHPSTPAMASLKSLERLLAAMIHAPRVRGAGSGQGLGGMWHVVVFKVVGLGLGSGLGFVIHARR